MSSKRGRVYSKIVCANPNCNIQFKQKNPKHRTCNKEKCKEWLLKQNKYNPVKYKLSNKFIEANFPHGIDNVDIGLLTFTKNDLEKVKE